MDAINLFLPLRHESALDDDDIEPDDKFFNSLNTPVSRYFIKN